MPGLRINFLLERHMLNIYELMVLENVEKKVKQMVSHSMQMEVANRPEPHLWVDGGNVMGGVDMYAANVII